MSRVAIAPQIARTHSPPAPAVDAVRTDIVAEPYPDKQVQRISTTHAIGRLNLVAPKRELPSLKLGAPGDKYEREADRAANYLAPSPSGRPQPKPVLSGLRPGDNWGTLVGSDLTPRVGAIIHGGSPFPPESRFPMERALGRNLAHVRVHSDSQAQQLASTLHARAFTVGNHIVMGRDPSSNGRAAPTTLAHELAHTIQQDGTKPVAIQRSDKSDPEMDAGRTEADSQREEMADEEIIGEDSNLRKQLERLFRRMGNLLLSVVGRPGDHEVSLASQVFSEDQRTRARRAAVKYAKGTRVLQKLRSLDISFAAMWLDRVKSTLQTLRSILREVSKLGDWRADFVRTFLRRTGNLLSKARKLSKHPAMLRGLSTATDSKREAFVQNESETVTRANRMMFDEGLERVTSEAQLQTVGMSDVDIDVEIEKLQSQRFLEYNPKRAEVVDAIIAGLKMGKVERLHAPETTQAQRLARLSTVEGENREDAANLVRKMDESDLISLAKTNRERLGRTGLRFAESTKFQAAFEIGGLVPGANIVSERWEEEQAVERMSRAFAQAGGPTDTIDISPQFGDPDELELSELEISRSGDKVFIVKKPLKQGLEALDAARAGQTDVPRTSFLKEPHELVTIRQLGTGRAVTLPAFALLHAKDKAIVGTYADWAMIAQLGISLAPGKQVSKALEEGLEEGGSVLLRTEQKAKASIKATGRGPKKVPATAGSGVPPTTPRTRVRAGGGGGGGPKALPLGKEPLALPEPGRIGPGAQRTTPINAPNPNVGPPAAFAKKVPKGDVATKLGAKAENDAALILEKNGFEVQQLKEKTGFPDKTITTRIGGKRVTRVFDTLAPTTSRVENVMDRISEKVGKGQNRLILYLRHSAVDVKALKAELLKNPQIYRGLDEILAIMPSGEVTYFWP